MSLILTLTLGNPVTATEAECREQCKEVILAAKAYILQVEEKSELQAQLIKDQNMQNQRLTDRLDEANIWYRKPEFVIPSGLFIGFVLGAIVAK